MTDDDDLTNPDYTAVSVLIDGLLPRDLRGPDVVCSLCCGDLHRQRRKLIAPREWAHKVCAKQPQPNDVLVPWWLGLPRARRRIYTAMAHGFDPAEPTRPFTIPDTVTRTSFYTDADGGPLAVDEKRDVFEGIEVPRTQWHVLRERWTLS